MIRRKNDDGILGHSSYFQFIQTLLKQAVYIGQPIVILGPVFSNFRRIRVIGRNRSRGRIVMWIEILITNLTFMAIPLIEDCEKRLFVGSV